MYYLYGKRRDGSFNLVARFGSEQQLLAYLRYATLRKGEDGTFVFEQKTALCGHVGFSWSSKPPLEKSEMDIPFNPTPTML